MKEIKLISPPNEVEIHLPDGRVLSGPRGSKVGEFLSAIENDSQLVAAIINNDLRELTYPIELESRVEPVTISSPDGARIYRRYLTFLDRKSTRLNSSHLVISYAVFCLKKIH